MKPYKQTSFDPAAHLFAIALNNEGRQCSIGRYDTMEGLRSVIRENFRRGYRTEVAVLTLSQIEAVMKRVTG